jgi:ribosomal subunit interface protein
MPQGLTVLLNFKDLETDERVRDAIEARCRHLTEEFQEITRFEFTLSEEGTGFAAHGHVRGKSTDLATHAAASQLGAAADLLLDKVERQLRRVHDKRIFSQRRDAQRDPPKRKAHR